MIEQKSIINNEESAVLVGLIHKHQTEEQAQEYLDELAFLAETAGTKSVKTFTQRLPHPDNRTFVGKGKLEEIRDYVPLCWRKNATLVPTPHSCANEA